MPLVCRFPTRFGDDRFAVALGLSLLLHAASVAWLNAEKTALQPVSSNRPTPPETLHVSLTHADVGGPTFAVRPGPVGHTIGATSAVAEKSRDRPQSHFQNPTSPANPAFEAIAPAASVVPRFDPEELKAQARQLPSRTPGIAGSGFRQEKAEPVTPDILDRPALQALAKRLGKPPSVVSEQTLSDGSRLVRFSGNACLHIPHHSPLGQENQFGPAILVPTTCPD